MTASVLGLPKWFIAMVAYLKASGNEKTYSNYLWVAWEAEKEEAMEPSHEPPMASTSKPQLMSFFLCGSSKQSAGHDPLCMGHTPRGRECWQRRMCWQWRSGWHQRSNWGVHCTPCQSSEGCSASGEVAVITIAAWITSSAIAHWWQNLEQTCIKTGKRGQHQRREPESLKERQLCQRCPRTWHIRYKMPNVDFLLESQPL